MNALSEGEIDVRGIFCGCGSLLQSARTDDHHSWEEMEICVTDILVRFTPASLHSSPYHPRLSLSHHTPWNFHLLLRPSLHLVHPLPAEL